MPALIMATTPPKEKAAAIGFNSLMRSIGTTMSAAVIGVVLAQLSVQVGDYPVPTLTGFRVGLLIACGVAVLAALLGALTRLQRPPGRHGCPVPRSGRDALLGIVAVAAS